MAPLLRDEDQAGEYLGLTPRLLRKMRAEHTGPRYVKVGRLVRYRESDLDEWAASLPVVEPSSYELRRVS